MFLKDIENKLKELDPLVFYGRVRSKRVKDIAWNYIVFNRVKPSYSQNKTSHSDYYDVHIVRENFIPEDFDLEVIEKLKELPGVRLSSEDGVYNYTEKPNTDAIIEILTLHFVRARK